MTFYVVRESCQNIISTNKVSHHLILGIFITRVKVCSFEDMELGENVNMSLCKFE